MARANFSLLLDLPRELRDIIYWHYLKEDDGYVFHYQSGKLRTFDNRPIDLTFMYTCHSVAAEMSGRALAINHVTFSTVYSESERLRAGMFHRLQEELAETKEVAFRVLNSNDECKQYLTAEIVDRVALKFPAYAWLIEQMRGENLYLRTKDYSREAGSVHRAFVDYTLTTIAAGSDYLDFLASLEGIEQRNLLRSSSLFSRPTSWIIPSEFELAELAEDIPDMAWTDRRKEPPGEVDFWKRIKYRYSACATAISFLSSVCREARLQLRKIVLCEDHEAVAFPESHALGLIPYCLENPYLRIDRRVNIWRNVLPSGCGIDLWHTMGPWNEGLEYMTDHISGRWTNINGGFAKWIQEALVLPEAGMPRNAFVLSFDGAPAPIESSQIFDVVKTAAMWRIAMDQCVWNEVCTSIFSPKWTRCYVFKDFVSVIRSIIRGDSFIRCNFPVGELPDNQALIDKSRDWTYLDWQHGFHRELQS